MNFLTTFEQIQSNVRFCCLYKTMTELKPKNDHIHVFMMRHLWFDNASYDKIIAQLTHFVDKNICVVIYGDGYEILLNPVHITDVNKVDIIEYIELIFGRSKPHSKQTLFLTELVNMLESNELAVSNPAFTNKYFIL